jgi:hypothetical protein
MVKCRKKALDNAQNLRVQLIRDQTRTTKNISEMLKAHAEINV